MLLVKKICWLSVNSETKELSDEELELVVGGMSALAFDNWKAELLNKLGIRQERDLALINCDGVSCA
jgi:bacteriocin-like protein